MPKKPVNEPADAARRTRAIGLNRAAQAIPQAVREARGRPYTPSSTLPRLKPCQTLSLPWSGPRRPATHAPPNC